MKTTKKKGFPLIRQRTSKDPVSITNFFGDSNIRLEIKASKEDMQRLIYHYYKTGKENMGWDFFRSFLDPADHYLEKFANHMIIPNTNVIVGLKPHTHKEILLETCKMLSALFYVVFSASKDNKRLRQYLEHLVGDKNKIQLRNKKGMLISEECAAACLKDVLGEDIEHCKLRPFDDIVNFRKTYILPGKKIIRDHSIFVVSYMCFQFPLHLQYCKDGVFYPFLKSLEMSFEGEKPSDRTAASIRSILNKEIPSLASEKLVAIYTDFRKKMSPLLNTLL
jgi:hypothetical protein